MSLTKIRSVVSIVFRRSDVTLVSNFSLVDRLIVAIFLALNMSVMFFVFEEHLTAAEISELQQPILFGEGVFGIISWMLMLFILMPLVRLLIIWISRIAGYTFRSVTGMRRGREVET